ERDPTKTEVPNSAVSGKSLPELASQLRKSVPALRNSDASLSVLRPLGRGHTLEQSLTPPEQKNFQLSWLIGNAGPISWVANVEKPYSHTVLNEFLSNFGGVVSQIMGIGAPLKAHYFSWPVLEVGMLPGQSFATARRILFDLDALSKENCHLLLFGQSAQEALLSVCGGSLADTKLTWSDWIIVPPLVDLLSDNSAKRVLWGQVKSLLHGG
ncbi:MAG: hypothetical protein KDD43_13005, partial [Bdellovibrionales bacterium]|nr:hypothetical protein [Bdellovibrionales bacterium]